MQESVVERFIGAWGSMGTMWGINRSVARVHGLLIITDRPWTLDEISERLGISRSNVSTSLKELRSWNVVKKTTQHGDRKEYFICEEDVWQMLFSIMKERKRRELDPLVENVSASRRDAEHQPEGIALQRLQEMDSMLTTLNSLAGRALASRERARALLSLLEGKI